jgi:hypothetical protein
MVGLAALLAQPVQQQQHSQNCHCGLLVPVLVWIAIVGFLDLLAWLVGKGAHEQQPLHNISHGQVVPVLHSHQKLHS